MKKRPPIAFLSYVRSEDKHEGGRITEFRERLSAEVQLQTGEEFPIFQDRNDIKWGQNWKQRIEESIDGATFLIPIITPGFFKSPNCRDELERFLERESELNRSDLILPVYYVDCPVLNDEAKRAKDKLAEVIAQRQRADWRELRFEPFTSPQVGKSLAQLAVEIRGALERTTGAPKRVVKPPTAKTRAVPAAVATATARRARERTPQTAEAAESRTETAEVGAKPAPRTEPPTRVVDPMHRGDHVTITEAIKAAKPGDRILVRPGLYQEGLVIDKPLEIIGDGDPGEVIVQATGQHALAFNTTMGRVVNLTLRQTGGGVWYGVNIAQGRLELEDCDVTSLTHASVGIHGGADPRLRRNRIHDAKLCGVFIYENGQGTLEDNDIFANAYAGVEIRQGSNPTLRRNRIHDGKVSGVHVYDNGQGTLEDNDIFANASAGVVIRTGGNPTLRRNRIHDARANGIFVYEHGQGTLEDNDIFANAPDGVRIKTGGNPTLRRNHIHESKESGVFVYENGQGTLEDNDIFANPECGVTITTGGNPTLRRNRINRNTYEAVWLYDGGAATIEDNDLTDNGNGAWDISADCEANVKRARNLE